MILPVHQLVRARMAETVGRLYSLPPTIRRSPRWPSKRRRGAPSATSRCPVAFALARRLRKAPRAIAQELAGALGPIDGVARVEAAPNGYLNLFLDRAYWVQQWHGLDGFNGVQAGSTGSEKTIVEHTAINPNKAAHIGHLRNAALGDAFGRLLRFQGRAVEIQNYIDDTGVQVADVVVGFRELERKTLADVRAIAESTRFDYYCWDLYAKVTEWYAADADPAKPRLKIRTAALHDIEHGGNETADLGRLHRRAHRPRPPEDDGPDEHPLRPPHVGRRHPADEVLGARVRVPEEDRRSLPADRRQAQGLLGHEDRRRAGSGSRKPDAESGKPEADGEEQREKVIVRSDGTVTYVGKDMALQMWKFGLLDRDFYYRVFAESPAPPLWSTSSDPAAAAAAHPEFGHATMVCNVIDTRQAYLQKLLKQALAALGFAGAGAALGALLLRDGRAHAQHRARARVRGGGRHGQAVRGGVGPQGARRQGGRSARSADRQGVGRGRAPQHRAVRRTRCGRRRR